MKKLLAVLIDISSGREIARRKNVLFRPLVESDVKCPFLFINFIIYFIPFFVDFSVK